MRNSLYRPKLVEKLIFVGVVLLLTGLDLALLQRKFAIFTGGFLLNERISSAAERALFVVTILVLEWSLAAFFWFLFRLCGALLKNPPRAAAYAFALLYGGGNVAAAIVKYKVLAYFGDFLSLAILRNLGGGSLRGALLYGLNEFLVTGAWLLGGAAFCWLCWRRLRTSAARDPSPAPAASGVAPHGFAMLACLVLLAAVTVAAQQNRTMRKYLPKVTPYAVMSSITGQLVTPQRPLFTLASAQPVVPEAQHFHVQFGARKDDLMLIVSESTRADVIDATVQGKPATPNWRMLAREGTVAREYYSHTGFTTSSLKAIFLASIGRARPLGGSLFEVLKQNGYQVVVLSGQDEAFGAMAEETGAMRAADIFFDARSAKDERVFSSSEPGSLALSNERVLRQFDAVADRIDWRRPVFFYINLQAAHFPYSYPQMPRTLDPHPLGRGDMSDDTRQHLRLTYLNAVAYSDWATGELVARLKRRGVYQRSLVVVSGDHGESLFDDGSLGHGIKVSDTEMHTLLVANRNLPAFDGLLGQTDLAPALLEGIGAQLVPFAPPRRQAVLQIIGDPRAPSQLGYVYPGGQRFTVDSENHEISASWLPQPLPVEAMGAGTRESRELARLARDWQQAELSAP